MELEHIIAGVVGTVVSLVVLFLVWRYLCRNKHSGDDDIDDEETGAGGKRSSSTHIITKVHRGSSIEEDDGDTTDQDVKYGRTSSGYYFKPDGLADPFAAWTPKERPKSESDDVFVRQNYPKSPVLKTHRPHKNRRDIVMYT